MSFHWTDEHIIIHEDGQAEAFDEAGLSIGIFINKEKAKKYLINYAKGLEE